MEAFVKIQFAIEDDFFSKMIKDEEYSDFDCNVAICNFITDEFTRVLQKSIFAVTVQKVAISEDKTRCNFEIELTVPENSKRLFNKDETLLSDTCKVFEDFVTVHFLEKYGDDNQKFSQENYNLYDCQLPQFLKDNCMPEQGNKTSCKMFQKNGDGDRLATLFREQKRQPTLLRCRTF